jgi:hypothetical protein
MNPTGLVRSPVLERETIAEGCITKTISATQCSVSAQSGARLMPLPNLEAEFANLQIGVYNPYNHISKKT